MAGRAWQFGHCKRRHTRSAEMVMAPAGHWSAPQLSGHQVQPGWWESLPCSCVCARCAVAHFGGGGVGRFHRRHGTWSIRLVPI